MTFRMRNGAALEFGRNGSEDPYRSAVDGWAAMAADVVARQATGLCPGGCGRSAALTTLRMEPALCGPCSLARAKQP